MDGRREHTTRRGGTAVSWGGRGRVGGPLHECIDRVGLCAMQVEAKAPATLLLLFLTRTCTRTHMHVHPALFPLFPLATKQHSRPKSATVQVAITHSGGGGGHGKERTSGKLPLKWLVSTSMRTAMPAQPSLRMDQSFWCELSLRLPSLPISKIAWCAGAHGVCKTTHPVRCVSAGKFV